MVVTMDKVFRLYGSPIVLKSGGSEIEFRGFLHHSGSKSWENMEYRYGPLGEIPRGKHILLAPAETPVQKGDTLTSGTLQVVVRRIETVMAGDKVLYLWGLCVERGYENIWVEH